MHNTNNVKILSKQTARCKNGGGGMKKALTTLYSGYFIWFWSYV
jgi:hypothetical protein